MIKSIFRGIAIVRNSVAIVIVLGAAGATVAGAADTRPTHTADATHAPTTVVERVETETVTGTKTTKATEPVENTKPTTSKDVEPTKKPEPKKDVEPTKKPEPKPTRDTTARTTVDTAALEVLIKDCLARYAVANNSTGDAARASEACKRAIAASGLSSGDFWSRFGPKVETKKPEPTKSPTTTSTTPSVTSAQLEALVKDCFAKYLIAKNTKEGGAAAYEACNRAIAASGLTKTAFFAKFGTPGAT